MNRDEEMRYDQFEIPTYARFPLSIIKGRGLEVTTTDGEVYLDLYGGHAVCNTGHCHPHVTAAIAAQAQDLLFYSNMVHIPIRSEATSALVRLLPTGLDRVFFVNSGTEANENSLKIARKVTGREKVLAFEGGFHGRTTASLSATGIEKYRAGQALLPNFEFVPFGDAAAVEKLLDTGVFGAVILEPVQSMAGCRTAPAAFFRALRAACSKNGTLLIYDEVQTGMGRTGTPFYAGKHGVLPDVVSLGKALASGIPMGAVVTGSAIAEQIKLGDLGTTFGGGPIAAAALKATIEVIEKEGLCENAVRIGDYLQRQLLEIPGVKGVNGEGLLLGIVFEGAAKDIQVALMKQRIVTGLSEDKHVLRLLPPLTMDKDAADRLLSALNGILSGRNATIVPFSTGRGGQAPVPKIPKHFLSPDSLSGEDFRALINFAIDLKNNRISIGKPLAGKSVALVFFNPSLRTRASMSVAVHQLGGHPVTLDVGGGVWNVETRNNVVMNADKAEHIKEMAPVIGSYADMIAVRAFPALRSYDEDAAEPVLSAFSSLTDRPLINLESSLHHPCQGLGDMMTATEHLGSLKGKKIVLTWAYHPKALPLAVPNSFVSAAALCGANITIAAPAEFSLDAGFLAETKALASHAGGSLTTTTNRAEALDGSAIVYAKSWTSLVHYGNAPLDQAARLKYEDWIFDDKAFASAPNAKFMHCLPVRRNVEVSDGVLDSPRSLIIPEAANRLHGQKALLAAMAISQWGLP